MLNLSERIFPLLQLTRMALVFTAISNSVCTLLLWAAWEHDRGAAADGLLGLEHVILVAMISTGLYGFGMSLNDIIDRRRDRQLAAHRPIPSGRVGVGTAHVICALLGLMALASAAVYSRWGPAGWMSLVLTVGTVLLIAFYDVAGKWLVAPGLLTLGLIRFFHAVIPAPQLPLLWHPLMLLNHVTILSVVAYAWEEKRPPLTPVHWWAVLGGLGLADAAVIGLVAWRRGEGPGGWLEGLRIDPALVAPLAAAAAFVAIGWWVRRKAASRAAAGQALMLWGLLWLIIYDFTFAVGYGDLLPAVGLLLLLPMGWGSVQLMRWWGRLIALSQRPAFKRAEG